MRPATMYGIAIVHSVFNILCTAMLLPAGGLLERLAMRLVPDGKSADETAELDKRLLATPSLALRAGPHARGRDGVLRRAGAGERPGRVRRLHPGACAVHP